MSPATFRSVLDAARLAGVRRVTLLGLDESSLRNPEAQALFGGLPYFRHFLTPQPIAADVLLEEALPHGCRASAKARSYGVIGAYDQVQVTPWPGKEPPDGRAEPFVLGPPEVVSGYGGYVVGDGSITCLMLGADATPLSTFRVAGRALEREFGVLLATGGIDVTAPEPAAGR